MPIILYLVLFFSVISCTLSSICFYLVLKEYVASGSCKEFEKIVVLTFLAGLSVFNCFYVILSGIVLVSFVNLKTWSQYFEELRLYLQVIYVSVAIVSAAGLLFSITLWRCVIQKHTIISRFITSNWVMKGFFYSNIILPIIYNFLVVPLVFPGDFTRQYFWIEFGPVIGRFIITITSIPILYDLLRTIIFLRREDQNELLYKTCRNYLWTVVFCASLLAFGCFTYIQYGINGGFRDLTNATPDDHWSRSEIITDAYHYSYILFSLGGTIASMPMLKVRIKAFIAKKRTNRLEQDSDATLNRLPPPNPN